MTKKEILKLLEEYGAIKKGHFMLSSGLHSDTYVQCASLLQYPNITQKLAAELAIPYRSKKVDTVISPAIGGIVLGFALAQELSCRAIWAERKDGKMALRRGFCLDKDEKVLVVEDVVTTGGSVKEIIDLVELAEAKVTGVASIIDRGGRKAFSQPVNSLLRLKIDSFEPGVCPLCQKGEPLQSPGSRYDNT